MDSAFQVSLPSIQLRTRGFSCKSSTRLRISFHITNWLKEKMPKKAVSTTSQRGLVHDGPADHRVHGAQIHAMFILRQGVQTTHGNTEILFEHFQQRDIHLRLTLR